MNVWQQTSCLSPISASVSLASSGNNCQEDNLAHVDMYNELSPESYRRGEGSSICPVLGFWGDLGDTGSLWEISVSGLNFFHIAS